MKKAVKFTFSDGSETVLYLDENNEIRYDDNGNEVSENYITDLIERSDDMLFFEF